MRKGFPNSYRSNDPVIISSEKITLLVGLPNTLYVEKSLIPTTIQNAKHPFSTSLQEKSLFENLLIKNLVFPKQPKFCIFHAHSYLLVHYPVTTYQIIMN